MKLYVYDHCPFCVRARMPLGLKGIEAETVFLDNHDETTPISMIGAKMLPILEDGDGHLGESLDIVHKLDGLSEPRLFDGEPKKDLTDWLREAGPAINTLVIPRAPDPVFPEFRDPDGLWVGLTSRARVDSNPTPKHYKNVSNEITLTQNPQKLKENYTNRNYLFPQKYKAQKV